MRRIFLWLLTTISGMVLLFSYSTSTAGSVTTAGAAPLTTSGVGPDPAKGPVQTVDGAVVKTRWGPVQVQIAVQKHRIVAVKLLQLPAGAMDQFIAKRSIPTLIKETVKAQSADIDIVTTATYTSDGYIKSLQSALDKGAL